MRAAHSHSAWRLVTGALAVLWTALTVDVVLYLGPDFFLPTVALGVL